MPQENTPSPSLLYRIINFITLERRGSGPPLSVNHLALALGAPPAQIARVVRQRLDDLRLAGTPQLRQAALFLEQRLERLTRSAALAGPAQACLRGEAAELEARLVEIRALERLAAVEAVAGDGLNLCFEFGRETPESLLEEPA